MKTLALVPWDISKPDTGGKQRCFELLTAVNGMTTFALSWDNQEATTALNGMPYRVIPAGVQAADRAQKLFKQGFHSFDVMPTLCVDDLTHIRKAIDDFNPDLIILEHPWLVELTGGRPYVYDAHNFETHNTAQLFGRNSLDFDHVAEIERATITGAEHVTYCSADDWIQLGHNWQLPAGTHIPNGTHLPTVTAQPGSNILTFVGSMYAPNIHAAQRLADLASLLPEYEIHLAGHASNGVRTTYDNVKIHGYLSDDNLAKLLAKSHQFVCLTTEGSGTHLKIAQALAYGLPVVTLETSARGYTATHTTTLEQTPQTIRDITSAWDQHHTDAHNASHQYDWQTIRHQFAETIYALQ